MANEKDRWLAEAQGDWEIAEILLREARYNASAFYSQQSAEKALKAILYGVHEQPWGHSVRDLLNRIHQIAPLDNIEGMEACARILDRHYIGARYPNAYPSGTARDYYDEKTAAEALECAQRFLEILTKL